MKVSIIVPVHNAANTIQNCVNSIINQNYKEIECILVENGSEDNSYGLCLELSLKYNNIIVTTIEETGVSNARNKGLSLATGDIIGFCDADDFMEPGAISKVVVEFNDLNVAAVFGGFNIGIVNKNYIDKYYRGIKEKTISITKAIQLNLSNDSVMGSVWNKYYRAQFLKNKEFDKKLSLCEDMHFNAIVLNSIGTEYSVKIINTPLYCYMENFDSVTHNEEMLFDKDGNLKYIVTLEKIYSDCNLDSKTVSCLKMKMACFAIDYLTDKMPHDRKEKLIFQLKKNYVYLLKNLFVNNWKWNIKRAVRGCWILLRKGY